MATPNGGAYDEEPPRFVSSMPKVHQTNYTGKKVEIRFDELIQIEKPSENVIITPPQINLPDVRGIGKKITVELKDTLRPNTTYTIDFTNSISDNNEKNVLENFSFAFSTGDVIDSLEVSGYLLNAEDLEPMPNILIGLHDDLADSAFTTKPFLRTSMTNERGRFTIRNIAEGSYRVYALKDANRDYLFDQPGEELAFHDSIITPTFEFTTRQDTTWRDSTTVDTIRTVPYTRFMPDDIVLRLFKEKFQRQYMLRPERPQENLFLLKFNAPVDSLPETELLNIPASADWYLTQKTDGGTTLNYWIKDSLIYQKDTILLRVTYPKTDSLNIPRPQTDTVRLVYRKPPPPKTKRSKKNEPPPVNFLEMTASVSGSMNLLDTLSITFPEPVLDLSGEIFSLELQQQDTLWIPAEFTFRQDTANALKFYIERPWKYGESYRLNVDSASIYSIYGKWNNVFTANFTLKSRDDYGHLYIYINGVSEPAFVELLDANDAPVRKAPVKDGGVLFQDLTPGKYYARIVLDTNENGLWDTGNYAGKLQPERVYYSTQFYQMPANFEIEETWSVSPETVTRQKPMEITKNKPKDVTKQKRNYKEEGKSRSTKSSSSSMPGMPGGMRF
ncbi:MAG: Ig-like domain-containing protein [Tannerella sp.]|nr:Ig-like domain-containing protein [Tannerella sp.]